MMPADNTQAWLNGRFVLLSEAAVPVWDLAVVAGATVSEMARTYRHTLFRPGDHLDRLLTSCRELGFSVTWKQDQLLDSAEQLVRRNLQSVSSRGDLGIVWFISAGINPVYAPQHTGGGPTACIHTFPIPFARWKQAVQSGVRLTIPDRQQLPPDVFPVAHKTRNRLHWWLADRAADIISPGSRALLPDARNNLTETSTTCFFAVIDNAVISPRSGVLNSLTCRIVRELCRRTGIRFQRDDLPLRCLNQFQEAFLSSTPCGLLPVASIDNHALPGPRGPVLTKLQAEWTHLTGVDTFEQILQAV